MSRSREFAAIFGVLLLAGVPAAAGFALYLAPDPLAAREAEVVPTTTRAAMVTESGERSLDLKLNWAPGGSVVAPNWSGTVTAVDAAKTTVREGDCAIEVDRVCRIPIATDRPFHRFLDATSHGADVEMLNDLLVRLSLTSGSGASWTLATTTGVRALQAELGLEEPQIVNTFDPAWTIWMPATEIEIEPSQLIVGSPAPGAGEVVMQLRPRIAEAVLVDSDGRQADLDAGRDWIATVGDVSVPVAPSGSIPPKRLPGLEGAVPSSAESVPAVAEFATPESSYALPLTAVITGDDEGACVWIEDGNEYRSISVEVLGGGVDSTRVIGDIDDQLVLANPVEILDDGAQCGS